jgi:hydroxysqualene dehydroxylase
LPGGAAEVDRVVVAVPPANVARLFDDRIPAELGAALARMHHESIATAWLAWRGPQPLPRSVMLVERTARAEHGQWLFDRGLHRGTQDLQIAGVVVSASGRRAGIDPQALADAIARQVSAQLHCPAPAHARAIVDKRATTSCTPDRPRIDVDALAASHPGIALAGDYVFHDYPATLESAVRSGIAAARSLLGPAPASAPAGTATA